MCLVIMRDTLDIIHKHLIFFFVCFTFLNFMYILFYPHFTTLKTNVWFFTLCHIDTRQTNNQYLVMQETKKKLFFSKKDLTKLVIYLFAIKLNLSKVIKYVSIRWIHINISNTEN